MPQMGADMTEGTLIKWIKQVGDPVKRNEVIAEIETDKATVELESFDDGVMKQHVVEEGETVPVGEVIALLGTADEVVGHDAARKPAAEYPARRVVPEGDVKDEPAAPAPATAPVEGQATATAERPGVSAAPSAAAAVAETSAATASPATTAIRQPSAGAPGTVTMPESDGVGPGRIRISPVARNIALEAGLDVTKVKGTGPDGRIIRRDVEAALEGRVAAPAPLPAVAAPVAEATPPAAGAQPRPRSETPAPAAGVVPLSRMRQAIARRMTQSKQTQPHYYLTLDVDMTAALDFRTQLNTRADETHRVSINDLVVKACALALGRHPKFNAEFSETGLVTHESINIDIGIALDEGLIAPALIGCGGKSLGEIAAESKDLVERAKTGHLRADEYSGGTFTITNLGAYGVEALIGIINPPQAAILGVGSVMAKPAVVEGQIAIRQLMKIALSADHRVSDGAEGARFIKEIQAFLENPASLAL